MFIGSLQLKQYNHKTLFSPHFVKAKCSNIKFCSYRQVNKIPAICHFHITRNTTTVDHKMCSTQEETETIFCLFWLMEAGVESVLRAMWKRPMIDNTLVKGHPSTIGANGPFAR